MLLHSPEISQNEDYKIVIQGLFCIENGVFSLVGRQGLIKISNFDRQCTRILFFLQVKNLHFLLAAKYIIINDCVKVLGLHHSNMRRKERVKPNKKYIYCM